MVSNEILPQHIGGDLMTDSAALRQLIAERGLKLKFIAEKLNLSAYGLALKIDNTNEFKTSEISTLCELLGVTSLREKERIFFAQNVEK